MPNKFKLPEGVDFTFETERLLIRPLEEQDREFFIDLHTNEKIMKYNGGKTDLELANRKFDTALKSNIKPYLEIKILVIRDKVSNHSLGLLFVLHSKDESINSIIETGIILDRLAQGKNVPEEAISNLLTYLFTNTDIQKVIAKFSVVNLATKRFVTKLGFSFNKEKSTLTTHYIYYNKANWLDKALASPKVEL